MKRIFTILGFVTFCSAVSAQNMITNGDLETWTDATQKPDGWFSMGGGSKETTIVHGGANAVKISPVSATANGNLDYVDVAATENTNYTISYWVLDNDPNARARHWIQFRSSGGNISAGSAGQPFQPSTYTSDNPQWVNTTATALTPAGTTLLRLSLRVYAQNNVTTGAIYFDDIVLVPGSTLGTQDVNLIKNSVKLSSSIVSDNLAVYAPGKINLKIINSLGQTIYSSDFVDTLQINTSEFSSGTYFLQVQTGESLVVKKFIKK